MVQNDNWNRSPHLENQVPSLSLLPPTPICFNFFMSLLFLLFLTNRIFTTVSMACYLLGFYVVALGRRGTPLSSLSLVVHALLLLLLLLIFF